MLKVALRGQRRGIALDSSGTPSAEILIVPSSEYSDPPHWSQNFASGPFSAPPCTVHLRVRAHQLAGRGGVRLRVVVRVRLSG